MLEVNIGAIVNITHGTYPEEMIYIGQNRAGCHYFATDQYLGVPYGERWIQFTGMVNRERGEELRARFEEKFGGFLL